MRTNVNRQGRTSWIIRWMSLRITKKKMGKNGKKAAKATYIILLLVVGFAFVYLYGVESKKENERRFLFNDTIEIGFFVLDNII